MKAISAPLVHTGTDCRPDSAIVIDGGRIATVCPRSQVPPDVPIEELGSGLLCPGFVDLQANGAGGVLFTQTPTADGIARMAAALARHGTTSFLATCITADDATTEAACDAVVEGLAGGLPGLLGLHLEGPMINPARAGAHDPALVRGLTEPLRRILSGAMPQPTLITLAPECLTSDELDWLVSQGAILFAGHSEAGPEDLVRARRHGLSGATHIGNAMSGLSARAPGLMGSALADDGLTVSLIADGGHVHPVTLKLAIAAKPEGLAFLVSDGMPPMAGGPDAFTLSGRAIRRDGAVCRDEKGGLAGSASSLLEAVRILVTSCGIDRIAAIAMATAYPARAIGAEDRVGRFCPGAAADILWLEDDLGLARAWQSGKALD